VTTNDLEALRRFTTPTVSNALERLGVVQRDQRYTDSSIRCLFPEFGAIVGYACTLLIRSAGPCQNPRFTSRKPYWDHILASPGPRIVVSQDLDQPPRGAYFGEVNANIHRALGCVGLITNGCVRDLEEVRALGFPFYAAAVSVSHAYCHLEDFNQPVTVGGMNVRPGELIHADRHGALVIPPEYMPRLTDAAREVEQYERPMIDLCKSPDFSTQKLAELLKNEGV
jgi:4-hydroxy-4-methyl-2-oxoglutarate aldolase